MSKQIPSARRSLVNGAPPKQTLIPHKEPPPGANPVLRGLILVVLTKILQSSNFLQGIFWSNAGFAKLRNIKELYDLEARYDPTTVPILEVKAGQPTSPEFRGPKTSLKDRFYTVEDYHNAYKAGTVTPTAVAETLLAMISKDPGKGTVHSTAFLALNAELVRKTAAEATQRYKAGNPRGILDGVPIAVKDEVDVKGYPRCMGTKIQYSDGTVDTSWCVKMWEDEGAVMIGKLTMHELGFDTTNNNPNYGTPLNPYNSNYYTGGSSGGSGYAVGQGLVPFALGADGGGSIRIPSNYCGIYGLKPSHGRISAWPTPDLATSTAVVGPMAANMADLELAYRVMAQPDSKHPSSSQFTAPQPSSPKAQNEKPPLGICKQWFDRADPEVLNATHQALDYLRDTLGYKVVDISIPHVPEGQMAHAMTIMSEILSATPPENIAKFTAPNRILFSVASQHPASDLMLAQRLRGLLMSHLAALYEEHPGLIIVTPTTPNAGWRIGAGDFAYGVSDANMSVRSMEYVWLANFCGCPAINAPVGYADAKGGGKIPVGIMGMADWGAEETLIEWGFDIEAWMNGIQGRERPEGWVDLLGAARNWQG